MTTTLICRVCETPFKVKPYRKDSAKYCSQKCKKIDMLVDKIKCICKGCGKEFEVYPSAYNRGEGVFCSPECTAKFQVGEENPNWRGGVSAENAIVRGSIKYKEWAYAVKKQANFTCGKCGQVGGKLVSHHLEPFWEYPESRFDIDNGVCMCKECHDAFHVEFGRKYFNTNNYSTYCA